MVHTNLKQGTFTSPQSGNAKFKRYIVENLEDLKAFAKAFPHIKKHLGGLMYNNLEDCVNEGYTVLLTDNHHLSGMPTYCFENKDNSTHPSSFNRVEN